MIYRIKNRWLRGVVAWLVLLLAVVWLPVLAAVAGVVGLAQCIHEDRHGSMRKWRTALSFKEASAP
jgi:fatty acid desaturase